MAPARAWYNENDPAACAALRALVAQEIIAHGPTDERSIKDVIPEDLAGFAQCHFFAGGGLWSIAARLAGWPDDRPLWTGSCPCQPFSAAGKRGGRDDPRHLWPDFFRLIRAVRPAVVVGEQVAGKAGYGWFDGVRADLEGENYACRAVDIPACSMDAPHLRQRLYWVALADAARTRSPTGDSRTLQGRAEYGQSPLELERCDGGERGVAQGDTDSARRALGYQSLLLGQRAPAERADAGDMVDAQSVGRGEGWPEHGVGLGWNAAARPNGSYWSEAEWLACHDGKARRAKPSLPLLVDGFPGRVDIWRLAGNAIVPQLAAEVLRALL